MIDAVQAIGLVLESSLLYVFLQAFLLPMPHNNKAGILFIPLACLMQLLRYMLPIPLHIGTMFLAMFLPMLFDYVVVTALFHAHTNQKLFYISLYHIMVRTCETISIAGMSLLSGLFIQPAYVTGNIYDQSVWELCSRVGSLLLLTAIILRLQKLKTPRSLPDDGSSLRSLTAVPAVLLAVVCAVFPFNRKTLDMDGLLLLITCAACVTGLCLLLIRHYVMGLETQFRQKELQRLYEHQRKYYQSILQSQRQAARMAHDLRKHIVVLMAALNRKDCEKAEKYLMELDERYSSIFPVHITGHPDIDALLAAKEQDLRSTSIKLKVGGLLPDSFRIDPVDISILLGNALDNATAACRMLPEPTIIRASFWLAHNRFVMEVTNPHSGAPEGSGLGLELIRQVCEKYGGCANIHKTQTQYTLTALLFEQEEPNGNG